MSSKPKKILKKIGLVAGAFLALFSLFLVVIWYVPDQSPKPGTIRVACVGDSITFGMLALPRALNTYPAQLQKLLGDNYSVHNFGVNGHTAQKAADQPYWHHKDFERSSEYAPNVVVIMLGTNDAKSVNWKGSQQFIQDYGDLVTHYQSLPSKPVIYLMSPPAAFTQSGNTGPNFGVSVAAVDEITVGIKQLAQERGLVFIDINAATAKHPEYFTMDGIHPDATGTKLIAETVYAAMAPSH